MRTRKCYLDILRILASFGVMIIHIGDFIRSCSIFLVCKALVNKEKTSMLAAQFGVYSFTAYLVHQMVITLLNRLGGLNTLSFNAALSVPTIGVITFVISYVVAYVVAEAKLLFKKARTL